VGLLDLAVVEAEMKAEAEQAKSEAKENARVDREAQEEAKRRNTWCLPGNIQRESTSLGTREDCLRMMRGQELSKSAKKSVQKEFE